MALTYREIISAGDFVDQVSDLEREWSADRTEGEHTPIWFRGQAKPVSEWSLLPKLHRVRRAKESELRREFHRRHLPFVTSPLEAPPDRWQQYHMMQHYGVATRLLDWTEGALLALYFAIRETRRFHRTESGAAVYALDPLSLNQSAVGKRRIVYPEGALGDSYGF